MLEDVFRVIDENRDTSIERLQALCRQPSIGVTGEGMAETADMVERIVRQAGAKTMRRIETSLCRDLWVRTVLRKATKPSRSSTSGVRGGPSRSPRCKTSRRFPGSGGACPLGKRRDRGDRCSGW